MSSTAEPVRAGRLQRVEDRLHALSQVQVGVAHDGRGGAAGAVQTAGAGRGQALHELDLADGPHLLGPIGAVHRARLDEHGGAHVVAAVDVGGQLVEQIALVGDAGEAEIPEVMVGIADRELRLERGLCGQCEPVVAAVWHRHTSGNGFENVALDDGIQIYHTGAVDLGRRPRPEGRARQTPSRGGGGRGLRGGPRRGRERPALFLSTAKAERVDGGYRLWGHKIFGSLTPVWTRLGIHAIDAKPSTLARS
jgi:hypothetical protein